MQPQAGVFEGIRWPVDRRKIAPRLQAGKRMTVNECYAQRNLHRNDLSHRSGGGGGGYIRWVYAGTKVLTKGPSSGCPTTEDVSITITGSVLTFTDSELRSFPIDFEPRPDGSFDEISINLGGATVAFMAA